MRKASKVVTVIVFLFLYVPIIVLMVASFSSGTDLAIFKEFTFSRYAELFKDTNLLLLVRNRCPPFCSLRVVDKHHCQIWKVNIACEFVENFNCVPRLR